jgi:hypothetical protein
MLACQWFAFVQVEPEQGLSTHEKERLKMRAKIEQMEKASLEPSTWTMQGEVLKIMHFILLSTMHYYDLMMLLHLILNKLNWFL